jgi:hypothetical protein
MRKSRWAEQKLQLEESTMYADPKHIKKHPYKVSLNDTEQLLLEVTAQAAGHQPSAWIRMLAMERLDELLETKDSERAAI